MKTDISIFFFFCALNNGRERERKNRNDEHFRTFIPIQSISVVAVIVAQLSFRFDCFSNGKFDKRRSIHFSFYSIFVFFFSFFFNLFISRVRLVKYFLEILHSDGFVSFAVVCVFLILYLLLVACRQCCSSCCLFSPSNLRIFLQTNISV